MKTAILIAAVILAALVAIAFFIFIIAGFYVPGVLTGFPPVPLAM